jgi:hypothetical protein
MGLVLEVFLSYSKHHRSQATRHMMQTMAHPKDVTNDTVFARSLERLPILRRLVLYMKGRPFQSSRNSMMAQ